MASLSSTGGRICRLFALLFVVTMGLRASALAQQLGPNVNVGPSAEGGIAINPTDPTNLIACANGFVFFSLNSGATWAEAATTSVGSLGVVGDGNVEFDSQGTGYLQGLQFPGGCARGIYLWKSTNNGQTYPGSQANWVIDDPNAGSDQPFMAVDDEPTSPFKDNVYVVWSEYGNSRCVGGTTPNACCDPMNPCGGAGVCTHFLPTLGNTPAGFYLLFSRSTDGGATFSTPIDISAVPSCGGGQEHSASITTGPNGEVYVAWISGGCGDMMLDKSLDGGVTWGTDRVVRHFPTNSGTFAIAGDVRGNPTVTVDRSTGPFRGRIYVSSIDINGPSGGAADAWVVHSSDGGTTWSSAVFISDGPRGAFKYYFQPRISATRSGRVDAAWYDTRLNTSTNVDSITYDLFASYSIDGGTTWRPNIRVTDVSSVRVTPCQQPCDARVLYEYIGLASDPTRFFPLWTDLRTGTQRQFTAKMNVRHAVRCSPRAAGCGG